LFLRIQTFTVRKRFALRISRGINTESTNVWVAIEQDGIWGWGEATPFAVGSQGQTTKKLMESLQQVAPRLARFHPLDRQQMQEAIADLPSAARAALDMACWDWLGKRSGLPLWRIWGLDRSQILPTSVTIGISAPLEAQQRVLSWLELISDLQVFKVKLGNPAGIAADREMLEAVLEAIPPQALVYVDANGGWSLEDAIFMCNWLGSAGIRYVEQPLPAGRERDLRVLYERSPLPIFVDESCFTSKDIPQLTDCVHGINIKLMKSGGLTEAMGMVHTAKALGLQVMFGCYSDSILANTAAAQLAPLADYLDLDSHLNLVDDPFTGALMEKGRLLPNDLPGLGVTRHG